MPTELERLATLEERTQQIHLLIARVDANTRDIRESLDTRLDEVDKRVTKVETHLSWMKGIFATVQGAVLAVVGWMK